MNLAHSVREISSHFIQNQAARELWITVMNFYDSIQFHTIELVIFDQFSKNWLIILRKLVKYSRFFGIIRIEPV